MNGDDNDDNDTPAAVITGGGGALAREIARVLRERGWRVLAPPRAELDVRDAAAARAWFAAAGPVRLLVNNAGIKRDAAFARLAEADWDAVLDTCLRGAFLCAREAGALMAARGEGHIVNIGSFTARRGVAGQAAYGAAKAALAGFTQSLAAELGPAGVRVNLVLPGWLETPFTADVPAAAVEAARREHVLGRFNTVADAARFIAFLDEMRAVSGQTFQLDSRLVRWT